MDKRFWAIVGVIVLVFVGYLVFHGSKAEAPKANVQPSHHTRGKGTTGVTLLEYGDFQCPACEQYYPAVEQTVQKYGDQITYQFRNFPLTSLHPNAFAAARAAEAANKQGKFWDMYHKLYDNQNDWAESKSPTKFFDNYAKQIGLNVTQFDNDFKSSAVNDIVQADMAAGNKIGVTGTPTFQLDGVKIENPQPTVDAFSKILDQAIAKKTQKQ